MNMIKIYSYVYVCIENMYRNSIIKIFKYRLSIYAIIDIFKE